MQAVALAAVGIAITVVVYGVVGLIVKLDDIGLNLSERRNSAAQAFGRGLVHLVPKLLAVLAVIGTAAMLWVGGGILVHGLEEMHLLEWLPHAIHDFAHAAAAPFGALRSTVDWLVNALAASIVGLVVGGVVILAIKLVRRKPAHP
jgi:predicted DNA repair protein MutK